MIQKVFEIGNSIAVTIPKPTNVKIGTAVRFKQEKNKLIYELLETLDTSPAEQHIKKTTGSFKIKIKDLAKVLKSLKESQYESEIRFP